MNRDRSKMATVIAWQNGLCMVFDGAGQQMTDYQGPLDEVREKILADANPYVCFRRGKWKDTLTDISREEFRNLTMPHVHTRQCWEDPGPGHGPPFLVCDKLDAKQLAECEQHDTALANSQEPEAKN